MLPRQTSRVKQIGPIVTQGPASAKEQTKKKEGKCLVGTKGKKGHLLTVQSA